MRAFRIFIRESLFPRTKAEGGDGLSPLSIVGEADAYTDFEAIVRHNSVGSWSLTLPAGHIQSKMMLPGRGIVVYQQGESQPIFSGPVTQLKKVWDSENAGDGSVVASGVDDNYLLAERLAWPTPGADIHLAATVQYWKTNRNWPNVGELLRQLFLINMHGSAARRLDRVFIPGPESTAILLNDSTARAARIRFDRPDQFVGLLSASYGFRIRFIWHPNPATVASNSDPEVTGPGILLKIEPIADLTKEVYFGAELGNLRGYQYLTKAPEATRLIVATQNRTTRQVIQSATYDGAGLVTGYTERTEETSGPERWHGYFSNNLYDPEWWGDPAATPANKQHTLAWAEAGYTATETEWGITGERYKDKRDIPWQWVQDPAQPEGWAQDPPVWSAQYRAVQDEVDTFSLEQGPKASITLDPLETDNTAFGRDYGLGDRIRVIVDGEVRDEVVREARFSSNDSDGPRVKPTIGTLGSGETPYLYAAVRSLWDRVHGVETREDLKSSLDEVPFTDFDIRKAA